MLEIKKTPASAPGFPFTAGRMAASGRKQPLADSQLQCPVLTQSGRLYKWPRHYILVIEPPSAEEVEETFVALLRGDISRDEADRWAAKWVVDDRFPMELPEIWNALCKLHGCDLTHGPGLDYLFTDEQIAEWLEDFRNSIRN